MNTTDTELLKKNYLLGLAEKMVMIGHWQWFLTTNDVLWSDNLYTLFQHERNDLLTYDTYFGYVHPDDKDYVAEQVAESIADKEFRGFYHRILLKDGTVKNIHLMGKIFLDESGNVVEMIGTCQDVTAQKAAEAKLAESENLYRYLYEHAHAMHFSVSPKDAQVIKCNQTLCDTLRCTQEDVVGQSMFTLFPLEQKDIARNAFERFRTAGEVQNVEVQMQKKNGFKIDVLLSATPVRDDDGAILYNRVSCIDVSDMVHTTKKLKLQNQRLSDFCGIISHNLRGPLTNISMLADYLHSTELSEEQQEMVGQLNGVVHHLNEVFNELVESISIRYDTDLQREEIDLASTLESVMKTLDRQIEEADARITYDFTEVPKVHYPRPYLESILSNLLSNALKYRSPHRTPRIQWQTESLPDQVILSVRDNGLGLDTEAHKHNLFKIRKVFHNHPDARGFGLFMTKTQVEAMGGNIWVDSIPDRGATFYVSIPKLES